MSKRILLSFIILVCAFQFGYSQITGTVYRDFNGNGTRQTSGATIEPGAGGVIINTYDASNNFVTSTTSAADGSYTLPYTVPVRLEFVLPSAGPGNYCTGAPLDFTGFGGDGNNVRFITGSSSGIDYAIHYPYDYVSNTNPAFFFPQYSNGNPLGGGTTGTTSGFKGHLYNHTGATQAPVQAVAYSTIGATWGVAYSKQAKVIFTSALIKRHSGLGPLGSGGIYKLTPTATSFTVDQFYDLDANGHNTRAGAGAPAYGAGFSYTLSGVNVANYIGGIDPLSNEPFGLGVVGTNLQRNLPADFTTDNNDPAAMAQVGRVGLGDLDISDDGKYLFSVNLYQKVIHRLELNDPYNPTAIVGVTTFSIPTIAVTNGVLRPFGLGYQRGDLYLGAVASGENGGVNNVGGATDLYGYVFRLKDAATGSATFESAPVITVPLNYAKGPSVLNSNNTKKWYPWNNSTSALLVVSGESTLPTPILSDIDFTDNGDMVLDFMDRSGHQFGYQNYLNLTGTIGLYTYDIGGDILIAGKSCSGNGFTLENNGAYLSSNGTTFSSGAANNQGPGNSEFFKGDFYPTWHSETSMGSCAILKGNQNVLATLMDPINDFSSGFGKLSTTVGTASGALQAIRTNDDFGKANGLGDVEIAGDEPPLEIGNRVWNDANSNGIQDPTEVGIANVTVELYCDFDNNQIPDGASIGSTNTDGNGHFYFNTSNVTDGDCVTAGNQAGPQPGKNYLMIIGTSDWVAGAGAGDLAGLLLAPANSASNGIADASDNDATSIANVPTIPVVTSTKWGDNNHTYDFGFMTPPPCTVAASVVAGNQTVCAGGDPSAFTETTPATGSGTLSYQWESSTTDCNSGFGPIGSANSNVYDPPAGLTQTTYYHLVVTNTDGGNTCTDITNCITVTVSPYPTADAGLDATLNCTTTTVVIGTPAVAGNSYSWSPSTGLSADNIAQPTASPSSTTTYTVTVTNAANCATTDMVTITIDVAAPTADAGVDMTVNCTTTQVMIGTAAIAGNSYSWSPSTALSADNVAQPNANPSSTTTYTVTVTGTNGCTATDAVTVTVDTNPPTADAGTDQTLDCTTTSAVIGSAAIGGNTYSWSPSTALSATNIAQPTANPTSTTNYTVTVTAANGCTATDVVTVTVNAGIPVADAGSDMIINCTTTSVTIGSVSIGGNSYSWSPSTGLSSTTVAQPTATPSATTTYTVTVTNTTSLCTATDVVTVTVDNTPPTADAGSDMNLDCTTTSAQIGTAAVAGNSYSWSPSTGLSADNIAQPMASPTSTTTYTVTVTAANGCTATDMVTVNVNTTPPVANAGTDLSLDCTTTSGTIGTAAIAGNTYSWSPSTGLSADNVAQPIANSSTTTNYTVTVTGANGCTATDVVTVNVSAGVPVADAGIDQTINCTMLSVTIGTAGTAGNSYSWSPSTGLSADNIAQPTATPSATTSYTVTVTNTTSLCTATDVVTVTVDNIPPTADAGSDMNLDCTTTSAQIGTAAVAGNSYSWSPSTGLNADNIAQPMASSTSTTTYTVTVTAANGCTATDMVTVNVNTTPPAADAGLDKVIDCATPMVTIGTAAVVGNTYSWNPGTGLNDATSAQPNASPSSTTNYTVTVTATNGCTSTDEVTVTVNGNLGSVGNYVWMDENGNGIQDEPASLGINGVTVELWKETAPSSGIYAMVQTTTTASNAGDPGFYSFSICDLAQYKVKFPTTEAGSALTTQTATAATDNNSDANGADGFSPEFTIDPNGSGVAKDNMTIDAGYEPLGSIGNYVWLDENGNGINDELASNGINGVTVNLLDASMTVIATTTTANNGANPGYYLFDELNSGTYYVQFPTTQSSNGLTTQTATAQTDNNSDADASTGNSPAVVINAVGTGVDKDNMTIDAGYEPLGSIGNYVWLDENGNGINDEPASNGINGVTVNLLDASMTVIATTTTANDGANPGYYLFDELNSGTYYVQFPTTQSSNGLTTQTATAQTDNNSDADASTGNSPAIVLNAAGTGVDKDNMTIDAGYEPLGSIGNYVWLDENGNGINDEPASNGINGVTVNLLDASMTVIATTTTANDGANPGYYLFDELNSGTYYVQFPTTQSSNGLTTQTATAQTDNNSDADASTGNSPAIVLNAAGTGVDKDNMTIDAGYEPLGSIGNYVWLDENGNGINDEPASNGINGVTVNLLDASMTVIATTTTANDGANPGYYLFDELNSGTYYVQFPTSSGEQVLTLQTTTAQTDNNSDADQTTGTSPAVVILASGTGMDKDNMTIDAGFAPLADLGNYVWNDINQNGSQDPTEVGVAGITVTLMNGSGAVLSSTITDAYGMYIFNDLNPGTYKVGFTLPANYVFTSSNNTTDELDSDVDPNNGVTGNYTLALGDSNITVDAGIYFEQPTTASVGNFVWFDTNNDGIQDPSETGISGVTVTLYDQFGNTVATMPTDASGYYLFTQVPPGTYSVGFLAPPGLSFSPNNGTVSNPSNSDANPGTGLTSNFVVVAGDEITTVDAGLSLLPANVGSLGDKVWYDVDQDGEQENGETGVEGINVILYAGDGATVLSTTTTNAFGDYIFNNLPQGDYVVGFTGLPTDYVLTTTSGLDSTSNSDANVVSGKTPVIHLAAGQHNMTYDAGIYNTNANNTNSLGNYVWLDANKDGIQDNGESGVPGVTVTLYNSFSNAIDKTSTDLNGFYLFPNLPNGTYFIGFSNIPSGFSFTTPNNTADGFDSDADLTTGNTGTSTLSGGTIDLTLDAGIIPNSNKIGLGTLGDLVWYDLNNDGLQDPSEGGVQGVTATLYGPDGTTVLGTTVTDALGNYIFTGLDAGSYIVGFSNLPAGFTVSPQNADAQGVNGEVNSDVNSGTLQTPLVSLSTGEDKMSVDMGIVPPAGSASLGDLVWIDLNNDGLQTTGEPGVQGVTVTLYNGAGTATATTTTDANGNYYFVGLTPGTYGVGFSNLPAGYNLTTENSDAAGVNGGLNSDANATTGLTPTVNLLAGDNNLNLDAGLVSTTVASVGDYVWNDLNSDGVQDPNEPGLGGILVTLLDNLGNPVASTITKPDGSYIFTNVTPGSYSMNFSNTPVGMSFTTQETNPASNTGSNANASGNTPPFTVTAGTHNPTIDAGLTAPLLAGVGDYVWLDANNNGIQDPGEAPIAGALVTLYDSDGIGVLGTAVTDGNGAYSFTNLAPNSYMLGFTLSQVFTPSGPQPAAITLLDSGADGVDNDADPGTGRTATFPLAAGEYNPTFDAGFYPNLVTPIELGDFSIETQHCDVILAWNTLSEANTKQFNIERRLEGEGFVTIATVKAAGNSNTTLEYSYTDKNVLNGSYAYRLKLIDQDGKFAYSPLRTTTVNCSTSGLVQVYPIPAQDVLHVRLNVEADEVVELALTDAAGRVVAKQQEEVTSGDHILTMPINHVAAGVYYLRVTSGFNVQTFKVNKD